MGPALKVWQIMCTTVLLIHFVPKADAIRAAELRSYGSAMENLGSNNDLSNGNDLVDGLYQSGGDLTQIGLSSHFFA